MTNAVKSAVPIPAGTLFTISTGEYSDYSIHGVFRAKIELNTEALVEAWLVEHPEQRKSYHFDERAFIASLASLLEPIECYEFYVGDYGTIGSNTVRVISNEIGDAK